MENLLFYFFLLLGLFGIVLCLLGIILGVIGRIKIRKNPALISSKVRANAGIFIGIFALFASFIMSILLIYLNFFRDSDNDGFLNNEDNCPSEWGNLNGCLDTDNDYIANYQDICENEAGPEENNGCPWPDTDLDGVADKDDSCIDTPGDISNNGCPLEGSYVFWVDADETGNWPGNVSIYVDGSYVGEIDGWFYDNPGCNATSCVTVTKPPGTYYWSASSSDGTSWNGGAFEVLAGGCGDQSLWVY